MSKSNPLAKALAKRLGSGYGKSSSKRSASGFFAARKTPAAPSERVRGSARNPPGSATRSGLVNLPASTMKSLRKKADEFNARSRSSGRTVTVPMLAQVWRRGAGAYSSTHLPGMSRAGWAMARVNAFLYFVRHNRPLHRTFVDRDLLPSGHPSYQDRTTKR